MYGVGVKLAGHMALLVEFIELYAYFRPFMAAWLAVGIHMVSPGLSFSPTIHCKPSLLAPLYTLNQCCGSGSKLDPYSATLWIRIRIRNTDPDPHYEK